VYTPADKFEKIDLVGIGKSFGESIATSITKLLELKERLAFVMAQPAERREMQAQNLKKYEEERKRQLIPGYAEAQKAAEPMLVNYPLASEGPQAAKGAIVRTGEVKPLTVERPESLMSSLAKLGGGASGMGTESLNVQREQLSVMQQMLAALRASTNIQGSASMIDIYGNSSIAVTA
jgi:hypothetical protein